jgi:hypothetical protein
MIQNRSLDPYKDISPLCDWICSYEVSYIEIRITDCNRISRYPNNMTISKHNIQFSIETNRTYIITSKYYPSMTNEKYRIKQIMLHDEYC